MSRIIANVLPLVRSYFHAIANNGVPQNTPHDIVVALMHENPGFAESIIERIRINTLTDELMWQ